MKTAPRRPWWLAEPLSIIEFSDCFHVTAHGEKAFEPARLAQRMRQLHATAAHVFPAGGHLDGRALFFRHQSPGDPPPAFDYLEGWLAQARPAGIRTVVYFNVHSAKGRYAAEHPQWQQRKEDGSPKADVYTIDSTFCVNSPWRDWVLDRLRELCAYPIDGIFFDGPVVFADCCYCEHCRQAFQARYGCEMPPKKDRRHADFPKLLEFQSDSLAAFLRDSRQVIKSIRQDILFYMNSGTLAPGWASARDNRKLVQHQDILASEGGFFYGDLMARESLHKVGMHAKLLEAEAAGTGVPTLVFDCIGHKPWTYYMLPPAEVKLMWASSVAHRAGTWLATGRDSIDEPAVQAVKDLYGFARRHAAELFHTRSLASAAVMVSKATMNYYRGADVPLTDFTQASRGAEIGNFMDELKGWYRALASMQAPFDLIDDHTVEKEDLGRFRLIVLPNAACLSTAACSALAQFVRKGGTLVGTFETAAYDELGRRRDRPGLDEVFGVSRGDTTAHGPRRWDYVFAHGVEGWTGGIETAYIPSPSYALQVQALPPAEVPLTFSRQLADRYAGLAEDSPQPAMVVHNLGLGKAVYFACDFGAAMNSWRLGEHLQIVRNIVDRSGASPLAVRGAPPSLEVSLRRSPDGRDVLLHLVNYTGGMTRPIQRVVPLHGLSVELHAGGPVQSVQALFKPAKVRFAARGGKVAFRLGVLHEYELIKVRLRKPSARRR